MRHDEAFKRVGIMAEACYLDETRTPQNSRALDMFRAAVTSASTIYTQLDDANTEVVRLREELRVAQQNLSTIEARAVKLHADGRVEMPRSATERIADFLESDLLREFIESKMRY